ncbi:MAG: nitroreductase family protein [Deltaproteobacteria bacterium]
MSAARGTYQTMSRERLLTTKEAIGRRRSIRKFKPDAVPDECITAMLESARLAPSGCNAQPWRFKIVRDPDQRRLLARAAHNQMFIAEAPVVIVCCADVKGYLDGSVSGIQDLGKIGAVQADVVTVLVRNIEQLRTYSVEQLSARIAANVAIAIEHMVLRALDFGLGTCWIRFLDADRIKQLFGWGDNLFVVALLPVGYPAEAPALRKRLPLEEILID